MADSYRSVMEVLKWTTPETVLALGAVSRLWESVLSSAELWRAHMDAAEMDIGEVPTAPRACKDRFRAIDAARKQRLLVCAGHNQLRLYDCVARKYSPDFRTPLSIFQWNSAAALAFNRTVFVCGGSQFPRKASVFSTSNGQIAWLQDMMAGRTLHSAVFDCGVVYVFGGEIIGVEKTAERYDLRTATWRQLPDMSVPRSAFNGCRLHRKIYLCGNGPCEVFDTRSDTYSAIATAQVQVPTASVLVHGGVMVISRSAVSTLEAGEWKCEKKKVTFVPRSNVEVIEYRGFAYIAAFDHLFLEVDLKTLEFNQLP